MGWTIKRWVGRFYKPQKLTNLPKENHQPNEQASYWQAVAPTLDTDTKALDTPLSNDPFF